MLASGLGLVLYCNHDMNNFVYDTNILRQAMHDRGLYPAIISEKVNVSVPTINSIMTTGRGHRKKVYTLAKYLGFKVTLRDLSALQPKWEPKRTIS